MHPFGNVLDDAKCWRACHLGLGWCLETHQPKLRGIEPAQIRRNVAPARPLKLLTKCEFAEKRSSRPCFVKPVVNVFNLYTQIGF